MGVRVSSGRSVWSSWSGQAGPVSRRINRAILVGSIRLERVGGSSRSGHRFNPVDLIPHLSWKVGSVRSVVPVESNGSVGSSFG